MREYIRAASVVKIAKIRMWETDNTAMLQARYSPRYSPNDALMTP